MQKIIYAAMLTLVLTFSVTAYSDAISNDLENGLIRLRIIANSDSEADQAVKLKIRDAILNEIDCRALSPAEAADHAARTARRVLAENGFSYGARGEFCSDVFPKKTYNDITLPAGRYKAVKITLGSGLGHNWWCVLYPPVCTAKTKDESDSARRELKENLSEETYELITGDKEIKLKFKSAQIIKKLISSVSR